MPSSNAGAKSASLIRLKSGAWNGSVLCVANGLAKALADACGAADFVAAWVGAEAHRTAERQGERVLHGRLSSVSGEPPDFTRSPLHAMPRRQWRV